MRGRAEGVVPGRHGPSAFGARRFAAGPAREARELRDVQPANLRHVQPANLRHVQPANLRRLSQTEAGRARVRRLTRKAGQSTLEVAEPGLWARQTGRRAVV